MRAYLQLVRVPAVFTAMADILLGFLLTHESLEPWPQFALLLAASAMLYMSGMVFNDYYDRQQDARQRPSRPIPSGRVSATAAQRLGIVMLVAGTALGWTAAALGGDARAGIVVTALAAAVLTYDALAKRTLAGPVVMGACRMLNVLLGMSLSVESWQPVHWVTAGGIGLYIVGVTYFARTEARTSARLQLALGVLVIVGGIGLLSSIPAWATGDEWPPLRMPDRWFIFWGLIGLWIAGRCVRAIISPEPIYVQLAVKNCIFALVILDAATVLVVHDVNWALVILALLVPTVLLGRFIYVT